MQSNTQGIIKNTLVTVQALESIFNDVNEEGWDQREDVVLLIDAIRAILPTFTEQQLEQVAKRLGPRI